MSEDKGVRNGIGGQPERDYPLGHDQDLVKGFPGWACEHNKFKPRKKKKKKQKNKNKKKKAQHKK